MRTTHQVQTIWIVVGASVLMFVAACIAAKLALATGFSWRCPVLALLHIPCPSCGSTRALAALSELRWVEAWRFNPLLVSALPTALAGLALRPFQARFAGLARYGWPLFFTAVFLNWVYLLLFLPR